jgi:hypothetical protein
MGRVQSLSTFLDSLYKDGSIIFDTPVVLFGARYYPLLFFSMLLSAVRKNPDNYVTVLDLKTMSKGDAQRTLQSSFLGLRTTFWLGSLADLSVLEQQSWLEYLSLYKGPHVVIACAENNEQFQKWGGDFIEIPEFAPLDIVGTIATIGQIQVDQDRIHYFFKKVIEVTGTLSLDQACLLLAYAQVAGKNNDQFCKEMLPLIVQPQHSLFALSDAFFEKNIKKFLVLWQPLSVQFSIQFWISFWSEQLWRSYFYVLCMKAGRAADAKKIAYRLPYSFTQKSWKRYTLEPLLKGHEFLYVLDHASKNGAIAQEAMLDLFCMQFMSETL